jgi:tellurite resistance protein
MKLKLLLSVVIAIVILTGCYDTKVDEKGRTVRINKITGEMSVIDGNKIIKLKTEKEAEAEQEAAEQLGESKEWSAIPILNKYANTTLKTKWSDGNIYYQLYVDKNLKDVANYNSVLTIELYDSESFLIRKITVRANNMVVAVDSDGKTIEAMEYKEKMPMSEIAYKKIKKWDIIWSGFNY